jgi:uncharacterized surface protein with fasciclin (FAS1) repeats
MDNRLKGISDMLQKALLKAIKPLIKTIRFYLNSLLLTWILFMVAMLNSCEDNGTVTPGFKDVISISIQQYLMDNITQYSDFLDILESGKMDVTLKAYNPNGFNYTLFLPTNSAVQKFIQNSSQFSNLQELIDNDTFCREIGKNHIINQGILTSEFPIGTFPERTLSYNYLTVNVGFEADSAFYTINDMARIIKQNIEMSNGVIHVIDQMLIPVTLNTGELLEITPGQSIFNEALKQTGYFDILSFSGDNSSSGAVYYTILVERDSVFHKSGIQSFSDLVQQISPDNSDYLDAFNPLNIFMGYHIIEGAFFLDAFEGKATNYNTLAKVPLNINGTGPEIAINKGKEVLAILFHDEDSTIVDFIGIYFDESNVLASNGVIHYIDHMMKPVPPSRVIKTFEFYEEPLINEYKLIPGSYLIEDTASLQRINWNGGELTYVKAADEAEKAWNDDYIVIEGDFEITYRIPAIVQGKYNVFLHANAFSNYNASVIVYLDGVKLGGIIDLSKGGNPYKRFELGNVDFSDYSEHTLRIESLIPGVFIWDYLRFEPI